MCSPICRRIRDSSPPPAAGAAAGGATGSGRYGLSMCSGGSSTGAGLDERQHVLLAHAAAAAGAGTWDEVDPVLGGDPLDDRGVAPVAVAGRR